VLQKSPPNATEHDFENWLQRVNQRTEPFMAWLGVVFALLVGFPLVARLRPPMGRALDIAGWLIWAFFVADFLIKLALAPAKGRFLRRHWLQVLGLCCPRSGRSVFCGCCGSAGRYRPRVCLRRRTEVRAPLRLLCSRLGYLAGLGTVLTVALAELLYLFEHRPGGTMASSPTRWSGPPEWSSACRPIPCLGAGPVGSSCWPASPSA
jgi:voltage-gated potassium channel